MIYVFVRYLELTISTLTSTHFTAKLSNQTFDLLNKPVEFEFENETIISKEYLQLFHGQICKLVRKSYVTIYRLVSDGKAIIFYIMKVVPNSNYKLTIECTVP